MKDAVHGLGPKPPAFQFYARDWLSSTLGMPWDVAGVYIHLLAWSWDNGPLPNDPRWRARIIGPEAKRLWSEVQPRWRRSARGWINPRLERQRELQAHYRERAHKGAEQRWHQAASIDQAHAKSMLGGERQASLKHVLNGCSSSASASSDQDQPVAPRPVYMPPLKAYFAIAKRLIAAAPDADLGELAAQFKAACADQRIVYDGEITRKAIDAVLHARRRRA